MPFASLRQHRTPALLASLLWAAFTGGHLLAADLEVTHLERVPKYSSYQGHVAYKVQHLVTDDFVPYSIDYARGLDGQNESTRRWPAAGESVTWIAHVRNRDSQAIDGFDWQWTLDGAVLSSGRWTSRLDPGAIVQLERRWRWKFAPHRIGFAISLPGDPTPGNNSVEDFTNALALYSFIDQGYEQAFRRDSAQAEGSVTDSVFEWLQRHMVRLNALFEQADSPLRVRYDRLELIPDRAPMPQREHSDWDGAFPDRFKAGDKDLRLGGSGYYHKDDDIDYGLLHEIGHQLGVIDVDRLNVPPEQNEVNGAGYSGPECLMNGCSPVISAHTAGAMKRWHGKRRGYFGQYLYDLPATMKVRFVDSVGRPLEGARVQVFQKVLGAGKPERIPAQAKFTGTTDRDGTYELPNVAVSTRDFKSDLPNVLRPNPFGYVSNHGANGVLLFLVEHGEMADHAWLDITQANLAYWDGQTDEAVFERKLAIGQGVQDEPPEDLCEENATSWASWAQQGSITVADDADRARVGKTALRLEATGGFDNYVRYPSDTLAKWDLRDVKAIRLWCYSENPHSFQNASPWVRLGHHRRGWFEWKPPSDVLNESIGKWVELRIPIEGGPGWTRSTRGTPDLSEIQYLQVHADTWDYGFKLWLDGIAFERR